MPGEKYDAVFEIAAEQFGYLTVEQASEAGVSRKTLHAMARRGTAERVDTGLYRISALASGPRAEYMEASLWPRGTRGVLSHETALALHELSDANPSRIHVTLPAQYRTRRLVPSLYVLHFADLSAGEVDSVDGIPVTAPARTVRDCHAAHLGPALIRQAIEDGVRKGHLSAREARLLKKECLGGSGDE